MTKLVVYTDRHWVTGLRETTMSDDLKAMIQRVSGQQEDVIDGLMGMAGLRPDPQLRIAELERVARQAYDAMMDWHFVHGVPGDRMSDEEKEMGEACKAIADVLDAHHA